MRKLLLVVWLVSLAGILFLFGYIRLHGVTQDRTNLAGILGMVFGASFVNWAVLTWKAKKQAIIARLAVGFKKERGGFYVVIFTILFFFFVVVAYVSPRIRVWEAKREFRAAPFFRELSVYDPIEYQKFESLYIEIIRRGGTQQKASLGMGDELIRILPKYIQKASDESVVAFGSWMVASLEELDRANSDACYSFLFPHNFGDAELVKKYMSPQSGDKSLQVMEGIIVSAMKNPQEVPDEKNAEELLQPIVLNLKNRYGSDVSLIGGTAHDAPERKRVCEMATDLYKQVSFLPLANASTVLRSLLSVNPPPQAQSPEADLDSKEAAAACGKLLKLNQAGFVKLNLMTRLSQLVDDGGFTDEERKLLDLQEQSFQVYSLAYLTWDKPVVVSRAQVDKMVIHAAGSLNTSQLSSADKTLLDAYVVKFKHLMLQAFDLGRHDANISPCRS